MKVKKLKKIVEKILTTWIVYGYEIHKIMGV